MALLLLHTTRVVLVGFCSRARLHVLLELILVLLKERSDVRNILIRFMANDMVH